MVEHLDEALASIRRDLSRPGPRWVASSRLHVTLVFLGDLGESYLDPLERELTDALATQDPFTTHLAGGGTFGNRILWAGLEDAEERWSEVARAARRAVRVAGANVDARPWEAHLTVAYGRPSVVLDKFLGPLQGYESPAFDVVEAALIRSALGPRPTYEVLSRFVLGGTARSLASPIVGGPSPLG